MSLHNYDAVVKNLDRTLLKAAKVNCVQLKITTEEVKESGRERVKADSSVTCVCILHFSSHLLMKFINFTARTFYATLRSVDHSCLSPC